MGRWRELPERLTLTHVFFCHCILCFLYVITEAAILPELLFCSLNSRSGKLHPLIIKTVRDTTRYTMSYSEVLCIASLVNTNTFKLKRVKYNLL